MSRGDHIKVSRFGYTHHGVDCGDGTVIHLSGEPLAKRQASVRRSSLEEFLREGDLEVVGPPDPEIGPDEAVARAERRLGERGYNVVFNNCEHFASECTRGRPRSRQVQRGVVLALAAALGTLGTLVVVANRRPEEA